MTQIHTLRILDYARAIVGGNINFETDPRTAFFSPGRWVYIAKDNSDFKIGCTTTSVNSRMCTLRKQFPKNTFSHVCFASAINQFELERTIHAALKEYRMGREWFDISSDDAKRILRFWMGKGSKDYRRTPFFKITFDKA